MKTYYEDSTIQSVGTEPHRNYYIPYDSLIEAREGSSRTASSQFHSLDGIWSFLYVPSIRELPEDLHELPGLTLPDQIQVPGTWQNQGYDQHQYTNVRFPIPFDPPYVPTDTTCGVYRRTVELEPSVDQRYYLNFEGVDSNLYLWVNETFIGYDQVTHSNHEFEITQALVKGHNEITVLVMKWCDGTYFEDQDKFRTSGIIRPVYLLTRPMTHLKDYAVKTDLDLAQQRGILSVQTDYPEGLSYWLYYQDELVTQGKTQEADFQLEVTDCQFWNAENPVLYTLIFKAGTEYLKQQIGFREIRRVGREVLVNGQPIKLYGVNHHDTHPLTGAMMTLADYRKDLTMMKAANMNCIRTAHYPKGPEFYELTDEYGFYVINEADLECHGVVSLYGEKADYNLLAADPSFEGPIMERVERSILANRNFPSIIMWSMENESGYGVNFEKAQAMARKLDATRLIHNERSIEPDLTRENDFSNLDVISQMYPPIQNVVDFCEQERYTKPFFMCEYSHAMGNGPGDLKTYFDLMQKYPAFLGGCVWEWADHAFPKIPQDGLENVHYLYGGDFGEVLHDGNFCVDGLVTPDRKWTVSLKEYQNIHLPIQLIGYDPQTKEIQLKNITAFTTGSAYQVIYQWQENGIPTIVGEVACQKLAPDSQVSYKINGPRNEAADTIFLTISVSRKNKQGLLKAGTMLGCQQLLIKDQLVELAPLKSSGPLKVTEKQGVLIIEGTDFVYQWDSQKAGFLNLESENIELLAKPTYFDIWRAPTDNDRNIRNDWQQAGYDRTVWKNLAYRWQIESGILNYKGTYHLNAVALQTIAVMELTLEVDTAGVIRFGVSVQKDPLFPDLPRFGLTLPLREPFDQAEYLGYGPEESYVDKHYASTFGHYQQTLPELFTDYLKPQENGNHWHTKWVEIKSSAQTLRVENPRNFAFRPYSNRQLTEKAHHFELQQESRHYLLVDYKQNGIGSNSCGPYLQEEFRFMETEFDWDFQIQIKKGGNK